MRKPVLTIFYQFNPWNSSVGGIQTVISSFLKYAPSKFEIRMIGTGNPGEKIGVWKEDEYAGRTIKFMPLINLKNDNIRHLIPTTLKYTTALLKCRLASDFMHFYRIEYALATSTWSGEKTFCLQNDIQKQMEVSTENTIFWQYFPKAYFALETLLIKQFDCIYSCHSNSVNFYQKRYPKIADRITYFKNTVDTEVFHPLEPEELVEQRKALAQKLNLTATTKIVLFAGRLHPQKDPILLIRAFAALSEPNAHLLIAGDGELAEAVRTEIQATNLSERVTLLGAVKQKQLVNLYQIVNAFILTSVYEGLPLSVLEALACGTPIVTTDCGETPNLLTVQSGLVAPERTPEAIAAAISQVLQNPTAYTAHACVSVAEPYTAKAVVGNVYQNMLARWEEKNLVFS